MKSAQVLSALALVAVAACSDATLTSPNQEASLGSRNPRTVAFLTRNVFIGFDADAAIGALATGDPAVFGPVLQQAVATLQRTDFGVRAAAFAEEIARTRPSAVGLQEVYRIHADLNALGIPAVIDLDYLAILQAAIDARNLPYVVVATTIDTDMNPLPGIQLVDRDVLLVDASRVSVGSGVIARTFQTNIGPLAAGIDKKAGYIVAPLTIDGHAITVVTTHLESDLGPGSHPFIAQLRAAQALEIAQVVGTAPMAVVMGDLNDWADSPMYQVFAGAGFTDTWKTLYPNVTGNTGSCFLPDLSDVMAHCSERIDFVFERGVEQPQAGTLGSAALLGIDGSERLTGPAGSIWPSDHAGLVTYLLVPPAVGLRN